MEKIEIVENVKRRLSLDSSMNAFIEDLVDDTINLFLMKRYPFDRDKGFSDLTEREINWVIRATVEIYQGLGYANIKSYSESGLSVSFNEMNGSISQSLDDEITPMAGVRVV